MIRIIQNKLIIPRGDTGNFSLPISSTASSSDIAVFTIIDPTTKKYILQKQVTPENDILNIRLEHIDTVNLLEGRYVWDVKYYQNAVFDDEVLVSGDEVDSYYAAYDLPECEIRMTGDALLCADDNADSKLSAQSINFLQASVNEAISAKADAIIAQAAAEGAADATTQMANELADLITTTEQARTNANTAATNTQTVISNANAAINEMNETIAAANTATTNANQAAQAIQNMDVTAQTTAAGSEATVEKQVDENGVITLAFGIPRGDKGETGATGATGPKGDKGDKGDAGVGVPAGGITGQVLTKASGTDYDTEWTDPSGGDVTDVQVNGTSVVTDGVANVPIADYNRIGAVKVHSDDGLTVSQTSGRLATLKASDARCKTGNNNYTPIVPANQHRAVYFGLAKAAGADMVNVTGETLGIYPEAQKSAISTMLSAPVSVTGTTPTITALSGIQYVCGEVSTLDIALPESGIVDVVFQSGSTPTVLTITPPTGVTVKWANGFDPTTLEANTTYEINIMDGLGVAVSWT